jgi:hypothetical protein
MAQKIFNTANDLNSLLTFFFILPMLSNLFETGFCHPRIFFDILLNLIYYDCVISGFYCWLQIATLTKKNKILAQKYRLSDKGNTPLSKTTTVKHTELLSTKIAVEISPDSLSSQTEVTSG